jgi:hypothetical protein
MLDIRQRCVVGSSEWIWDANCYCAPTLHTSAFSVFFVNSFAQHSLLIHPFQPAEDYGWADQVPRLTSVVLLIPQLLREYPQAPIYVAEYCLPAIGIVSPSHQT